MGRSIELDIYFPQEQLAFEYQGEQHYHDIYALGIKWNQRQLDSEKGKNVEKMESLSLKSLIGGTAAKNV